MIKNKLIKTGLCALSLLSVLSPMVYAEDEQSGTEQIMPVGTTQDLKTVTLSYEVSESYEWNIHPAIDFGKNAGANQTVSVKNNTISVTKNVLRSGNKLVIKIKGGGNNEAFTISNGKSQTLDYAVNDGSKNLAIGDTVMEVSAGTNTANKALEFKLSTAKKNAEIAGSYNGTVSYTAEIEKPNFVGYYADIEGDGIVDGVIFADLAVGESGKWNPSGQSWADSYGAYSYSVIPTDELKGYVVSQESYNGNFGTKPVLSPSGSGKERFYIMALEDIDSKMMYTWYASGFRNEMPDYSSATSPNFGSGKANTTTMINKWNNQAYGEQFDYDVWGKITNNSWFVPSRAEWAAFAGNLGVTKDNYSSLGLSSHY